MEPISITELLDELRSTPEGASRLEVARRRLVAARLDVQHHGITKRDHLQLPFDDIAYYATVLCEAKDIRKDTKFVITVISHDDELVPAADMLMAVYKGNSRILVSHFNQSEVTAQALRGDTRLCAFISRQLWQGLPREHCVDLHNGLVTVSTILGLPVHKLIYYI